MSDAAASPHDSPTSRQTLDLVPRLRPFDLQFVDPKTEAEFVREMIPSRRRVGQSNFVSFLLIAFFVWLGLALTDPAAADRLAVPALILIAVGFFGVGAFRWASPRVFDLMNALAVVATLGLLAGLATGVGPDVALAFGCGMVIALFLTGTSPFVLAVLNATAAVGGYVTIVPRLTVISDRMVLVHAAALVFSALAGAQRGYLYRRIMREAFFHQRLADRLLANVLPGSIVPRLKAGETSIADQHASASVLFVDLVGFTRLSVTMTAAQLVDLLREIFDRFDQLSAAAGIEKIKTIGDAYMAAGGVADGHVDHVDRMAHLALDLREAFAALPATKRHGLSVRIGLHTGPVVAGVVGTRRLAYDLWGDTVNTASRMESHGEPGRVHVSQAFANAAGPTFRLEPRGTIAVKGKGELETFWLERASPPDAGALAGALVGA